MTTPTEREVLEALWRKVNPQPFNGHIGPSPAWKEWVHARRCFTAMLDAKAYESAALMMVPEGLRVNLSEWDDRKHLRPMGPWQCILTRAGKGNMDPFFARCDHATTPALALCAAIEAALAREGE